MKHEITMPVLSDTMQTGRLTRWNKSVGEAVKKGDALAEVETDKAILDVEAFQDGYLAGPLAPVEQDIPVRSVIAWLVDSPEELGAAAENAASAKPAIAPSPASTAAAAPVLPPQNMAEPAPSPAVPRAVPAAPSKAPAAPDGILASPYARGLAQELGVELSSLGKGPIDSRAVLAAALRGAAPELSAGPPYRIERLPGIRAAQS